MKIAPIVIFSLFIANLFANVPPIEDLKKLDSLSILYLKTDRDMAVKTAIDYLNAAKQQENNQYIGHAFHRLGHIYSSMGDYYEAIYNYLNSVKYKRKYADSVGIGESYSGLGYSFYKSNDWDKAIYYNRAAISLLKNTNNKFLYSAYFNLSQLYKDRAEYDKSINCLLNSRKLALRSNNIKQVAMENTHISSVYRRMLKYDSALKYDFISLNLSRKITDSAGIARALNNIGFSYHCLGDFKKAIIYFKESILLNAEIELANTYLSLADSYVRLKSITHAEQALEHSWKHHPYLEDYGNTVKSIAEFYKREGGYRHSLYFERLAFVNDSLKRLISTNHRLTYNSPYKAQEAEERYFKESYQESMALQAQMQQDRTIFITILSVVFLLIIGYLIKVNIRSIRERRQVEQEKYNFIKSMEERTKRFDDLLHLE